MIASMIKNAVSLYQARNRLKQVEQEVVVLENKKSQLNQQISTQTDPAALDLAIRNKLNLVQPGETVVVITSSDAATPASEPTSSSPPTSTSPLAQWWSVFNPHD